MIYVIGGPTGSGKTALAIALAKSWNAPLINADAFQMYQELNIGTNKELDLMKPLKPYLFDELSPKSSLSVATYQLRFRELINQLSKQHDRIIMVGGTGLYIKASLYDFEFAPQLGKFDESKYDGLNNLQLHQYLANLDVEASQKIHFQNRRRVLRAINILETTGKTKSDQEKLQSKTLLYPATFIGILPQRTSLYAQLEHRVDIMFKEGLLQEVENLVQKYGSNLQAFQAIGYKETIAYLQEKKSLEQTIQEIKQSTKRYAKRQITYFSHQLPMKWYSHWKDAFEELTR
ncbi:MAG: tRNA (adenosine(37)-N6)-dimethylallyltransferase MiaA [Bacilli bacterium]